MAQRRTGRKRASKPSRVRPQPIPVDLITPRIARLGTAIDASAGEQTISEVGIAADSAKVGAQQVRDWKNNPHLNLSDVVSTSAFPWPGGMYIPGSLASSYGRPRPPASRFYSDAWTDGNGASTATAAAGTMFAWAQTRTTDREAIGEGALGIRYAPSHALSYIRFQPEVNCTVTYRGFVEFWPMLVAGQLRVRGSLIMAAWLLSPIAGQAPELVRPWHEVPVFDTGLRDAASDLSPDIHDINMFPRNFGLSGLSTTFLLQGARTYVLGVVARARVTHNVTTDDGKLIPHDGSKFKLYAGLMCFVPDMFVSVQTVLIP